MLIKKDCYVHFVGENSIKANTDLVVIDQYEKRNNLVMVSFLDAPAKIDKIHADYKKVTLGSYMNLLDRETNDNVLRVSKCAGHEVDFMGCRLNIEKKKVGKFSHMIMSRQLESSDYIFNFNQENINELILKKLVNVYFIPCKTHLIQEALIQKPNMIKKMLVITKNKKLEKVEVYKFSLVDFKKALNEVAQKAGEKPSEELLKFRGQFTHYINSFKSQIVDNLFTRLEFFYDEKNVPEYVTTFPRPLPNQDLKKVLDKISQKIYGKPFSLSGLSFEESEKVYELYHKLDEAGTIVRTENFNPRYSKQYELWASGMKILEQEKFLYLALTMGAGKTASSLKINKYTCEKTMGIENHVTFILAPKSTITQWVGEIELIEKGKGRTKKDYDILYLNTVDDLIRFYNKNSKEVKKYNKSGKLVSSGIVFDKSKIEKPLYILSGKETFKLSQAKRPSFNISYFGEEFILKCPNCGQTLIQEKKKDKQTVDVELTLEDFFKEDKKGVKKTPKASNTKCKKCERLNVSKKEYKQKEHNEKELAKEQSSKYTKIYFENKDDQNKRIPTSSSEVWSSDYRTDNYIRNKIFSKIEPYKELTDSHTVFSDIDDMKTRYLERSEILDKAKEKYSLLNLKVEDISNEKLLIGYKPTIKKKIKKVSVIEFMKKRVFEFDTTIIDEAHEANKADSLIGAAQKLLFKFSKKVLLLSGTANNGYASSLHSLLSAAMPGELLKDGTFNKQDFISKYGILQAVRKVDDTGKISGKVELKKSDFKETEGINPVVFTKFLSKNFIMINTLTQLDLPLPPLVEEYIPIELDQQIKTNYYRFYQEVKALSPLQAKTLRDKVFKNYINNPYKWQNFGINITVDGIKEFVDIDIKNVDRDSVPYTQKDELLIKIIRKEIEENRKCFLFTDFINGGEYIGEETWLNEKKPRKITINDRICSLLEEEGIRYKVITTSTASVIDRKNWIEDNKDLYDVFICQPQLVNVGLNLVFCPTYIVYTPQYRYDIISQATRRGYRANSTVENRVYHLYFKKTCEEEIINRYQRKLAEAKAIEGDFDVNLEKNKNVRTISKMSASIAIAN